MKRFEDDQMTAYDWEKRCLNMPDETDPLGDGASYREPKHKVNDYYYYTDAEKFPLTWAEVCHYRREIQVTIISKILLEDYEKNKGKR